MFTIKNSRLEAYELKLKCSKYGGCAISTQAGGQVTIMFLSSVVHRCLSLQIKANLPCCGTLLCKWKPVM